MLSAVRLHVRNTLLSFAVASAASACKFPDLPPVNEDGADARDLLDALDAPVACSATTCTGDVLTVCGGDQLVERVERCVLGCADAERCTWIEPSNGLGSLLEAAARQSAGIIPDDSTIDTDAGVVRSSMGEVIATASDIVAQPGALSIRVFLARTWTIADARVQGTLPVAFVAIGDVRVNGMLDVSANASTGGPGERACGASGDGGAETYGVWHRKQVGDPGTGSFAWTTTGASGGGFGTSGGKGGAMVSPAPDAPGPAGGIENGNATLVPLRGGCRGGTPFQGLAPGYGGGAVQLVSASGEIVVSGTASALAGVHAGGGGGLGCGGASGSSGQMGGGCKNSGGGAGGGILLEAPSVRFEPDSVILAAGGGGGGAGGCGPTGNGQDAPPNGTLPVGGACPMQTWGQPAVGGAGAAADLAGDGAATAYASAGAGGSGLGRVRINTRDGAYAGAANALVRGALTTGRLSFR